MADLIAQGRWEEADLSVAEQAMVRYAIKLTLEPWAMVEDDLTEMQQTGLDEIAIGDVAIITAMFAFANRAVDGLGGHIPEQWLADAQKLGLIED